MNLAFVTSLKKQVFRNVTFWTSHVFISSFLGYLGLYVVYVLTVIISAYIYNRQKHLVNSSAQTIIDNQG